MTVQKEMIRTHNGAPVFAGFAKVRIAKGRTRLIEIVSEDEKLVKGWRVNNDGSRWFKETEKFELEELVLVHPVNVVERLALNTFFGELEQV